MTGVLYLDSGRQLEVGMNKPNKIASSMIHPKAVTFRTSAMGLCRRHQWDGPSMSLSPSAKV